MALRKASAYSKKKERPYTRKSNVKSKQYVKAVPQTKIVKFVMGDAQKFSKNKFNYIIKLKSREAIQIRDNAIEASRQTINRHLENSFGKNYYFLISLYPHHILREHKIAATAQSDRFFAGMKHSFGKPLSVAAQVKPGKEIFLIAVSSKNDVSQVRSVLKKTKAKLPCSSYVEVEEIKKE